LFVPAIIVVRPFTIASDADTTLLITIEVGLTGIEDNVDSRAAAASNFENKLI
jgi:hypothetical protein